MDEEAKNKAIESSLKKRFDILVPLKQQLTIRVALNQPEPVVEEEPEEEVKGKKKK